MSAQVPDLMKIGAIQTEMTQDVQTIITEPVVFNQNVCRITLQNIGFLHSMSRLAIQVSATALNDWNASNANATFGAGMAIHNLVERASLSVGGKTICEVEDFSQFMAYKSMFIANEINKERESVISGRIMNFKPIYTLRSGYSASAYGLDNGTDPVVDFNAPAGAFVPNGSGVSPGTPGAGQVLSLGSASAITSGVQVQDNLLVRNEPELQISLSDLFPFLRFNQLPLYMMAEQVSINIVWKPQKTAFTSRVALGGGAPSSTQVFDIKPTSVKLIADYLTFPGEIMTQYAQANSTLNFNYVDYRLTKRTYNGSSSIAQTQQILNVGGAGRIVNKLYCAMNDDTENAVRILGQGYSAVAPGLDSSGQNVQILTTNVRYNDEYLYTTDRKNPALQFHDIVQTESEIPAVSKDAYNVESGGSTGGGLTAQEKFNGHDQSAVVGLRGKFFYQAHKLNRNERINSRGIELETLFSELPGLTAGNNYTQRVWIEILRTATLSNGILDCYYA